MDLSDITTPDITELKPILDEYGVAILENYFDDEYADEVFSSVKKWLIDLDIGLSDDISTWTNKNVPFGPRYGMYQSIVSNAPKFWELREKFYPIFQEILSEDELLTSIDGSSFFPTINSPKNKADWAHIDQTVSSKFMCYQSQFVATNTNASFVCTPGSHKLHHSILKKFSIESNTNWHKFTDSEVQQLKKIFKKYYQIPILAKKGSIIFWDSRTIHSAKYPDIKENSWRAVFYISMRPKKMFSPKDIYNIQTAVIEGKTTNHWGSTIFKPFDRFKMKNTEISNLVTNSKKISYYPQMTQLQRKICDFTPSEHDDIKAQCLFLLNKCLQENAINANLYRKISCYVKSNDDINTTRKITRLLMKQYCTKVDSSDKILSFIDPKNIKYVEV